MNSFLQTMYNLIPDLHLLSKQKYPRSKRQIIATYSKLLLRYLVLSDRNKRGGTVTERVCGFTVHAFSRGTVWFLFREIFVKGEYAFRTNTPSPRIVDCGTNIGMSVLFFKWLYPNCTIVAFEPDPQSYALLLKNITDNNLNSVTAHNSALGGKEGTITLYTHPENPGSLVSSTLAERKDGVPVVVPLAVLSEFLPQHTDFVKIDIEGAETEVLRELQNADTLNRIQEMSIEYHHNIPQHTSSFSEVLTIIEKAGFLYQIHSPFSPLSRKNRFQDIMVYCYRDGSVQRPKHR